MGAWLQGADLAGAELQGANLVGANLQCANLARIIHQPEKSTREGDFVVQMNPKTTVS